MMAIRILLDHDVREEDIILVSLYMAEAGVQSLAYAFPRVRMLTTAVEDDHFFYNCGWRQNMEEEQFGMTNEN
jgi:uracil phosphoribosyltransferase